MGSKKQRKSLRSRVFKRDHGKCQICGCTVQRQHKNRFDEATVDHIIPKAKGGTNCLWNVQLACLECNGKKADTVPNDKAHIALCYRNIEVRRSELAKQAEGHRRKKRKEARAAKKARRASCALP